jgi:regulator of protease activity HflC (stomatin/prohibitin superfamily)
VKAAIERVAPWRLLHQLGGAEQEFNAAIQEHEAAVEAARLVAEERAADVARIQQASADNVGMVIWDRFAHLTCKQPMSQPPNAAAYGRASALPQAFMLSFVAFAVPA